MIQIRYLDFRANFFSKIVQFCETVRSCPEQTSISHRAREQNLLLILANFPFPPRLELIFPENWPFLLRLRPPLPVEQTQKESVQN